MSMKNFITVSLLASLCLPQSFGQRRNASEPEKLQATAEIPIMGYYGVQERETSVERFREMKESGVNINISCHSYSCIEALEKALNAAQDAGVKLIAKCPELETETEKTVKRLMNHPALFGYFVADEPHPGAFKELGDRVRRIQAVDNRRPCYINLLPLFHGDDNFYTKEYVEPFLKEIPVKILTFDHYPIHKTDFSGSWYLNLEIIAEASKKAGIPFWAFAMVTAHAHYAIPTVGEIKLQMYSNLAYGAQGLQYFTYFTPTGEHADHYYYEGPIDADGKRTYVYDRIKAVNREIQNYAGVFLGSKKVFVAHTGKEIPWGTKRLGVDIQLPAPFKKLETSDGGSVVSVLEKEDRRFLVIVNRDYKNPMRLTIQTDNAVKKVLNDGTLVPANAYAQNMEVDPGDVVIYTWKE